LFDLIASLLQLEWTYGVRERGFISGELHTEFGDADVVPPPRDELEQLSQLARFGNMRRLAERARYLQELDEAYAPFARQLDALVRNLEDDEIILFIEQFRQPVASIGRRT
jgi:hypothetical protein